MHVQNGRFYLVKPYATTTHRVIIKVVDVGYDEKEGNHLFEGQRCDTGSTIFFRDSQAIVELTHEEMKKHVPFNIFD